jgi:hypothetical protein
MLTCVRPPPSLMPLSSFLTWLTLCIYITHADACQHPPSAMTPSSSSLTWSTPSSSPMYSCSSCAQCELHTVRSPASCPLVQAILSALHRSWSIAHGPHLTCSIAINCLGVPNTCTFTSQETCCTTHSTQHLRLAISIIKHVWNMTQPRNPQTSHTCVNHSSSTHGHISTMCSLLPFLSVIIPRLEIKSIPSSGTRNVGWHFLAPSLRFGKP